MNALQELYDVVMSRKEMYEKGEIDVESQKSYTCYLFSKGQDKILKKCGEECSETIIAAKNNDNEELKNEICAQQNLSWSEVEEVLEERSKKIGNLKTFKNVDHNS